MTGWPHDWCYIAPVPHGHFSVPKESWHLAPPPRRRAACAAASSAWPRSKACSNCPWLARLAMRKAHGWAQCRQITKTPGWCEILEAQLSQLGPQRYHQKSSCLGWMNGFNHLNVYLRYHMSNGQMYNPTHVSCLSMLFWYKALNITLCRIICFICIICHLIISHSHGKSTNF